jgi:hypothetical protein
MAHDKALARYRGAVGLELRLRGWSYSDIAEAVGYFDKSGARKAVHRCITERAAMAFDAFRVQRFLELEDIHRRGWADAIGGHPAATKRLLDAADERLSLMGLG